VRNLFAGVRARVDMEGRPLTDTPIYDQISQELQAGTSHRAASSRTVTPQVAGRSTGDARRPVSVWTLVDQYRKRP
jgi:hypothetical protein